MDATFPSAFILIVCKTISGGAEDINSGATGWQNREWDTSQGVMHCRRIEVAVTSAAEEGNQEAPPWNLDTCWRTALTIGPRWDDQHPHSPYRFWRVACPVPIHSAPDPSSPILGWVMPPCPFKDGTVICEQDSVI